MSLLHGLSTGVQPKIQTRGREYYRRGAVRILSVSAGQIEAGVRGTANHRVVVRRSEEGLGIWCSCPYFSDTYNACKHIWAVLLAADARGCLNDWRDTPPILISEDFEEGDLTYKGETTESESRAAPDLPQQCREGAPEPDRMGHAEATALRHGAQAQAAKWKVMMEEIQAMRPLYRPETGAGAPDGEILYIIEEATARQHGLHLELAVRQRRKNGEWAKPKPFGCGHGTFHELHDPEDRRIVARLLGATAMWYSPPSERRRAFGLSHELALDLLPLMCRTGRLKLRRPATNDLIPLRWDDGPPWDFRVQVTPDQQSQAYLAQGWLCRGEEQIPLAEPHLLFSDGLMILHDSIGCYRHHGSFAWILALRQEGTMIIPRHDADRWLEWLMRLPVLPPMDLPADLPFKQVEMEPIPLIRIDRSQGVWVPGELQAQVLFDYDGLLVKEDDVHALAGDPVLRRRINRDWDFESRARQRLIMMGFKMRHSCDGGCMWSLPADSLGTAVRQLSALSWRVEAQGKLYRSAVSLHLDISSGIDWFELRGAADYGGQRVPLPDLLAALQKGSHAVVLGDGTLGTLPEEWLARMAILTGLGKRVGENLRYSRSQVSLLDALLAAQPDVTCDDLFARARDQLRQFEGIRPADTPPGFVGELRHYQRTGLGWLHFLRNFGFGGCLADDMGLGKTVQVLALLEARRQGGSGSDSGAERRPSLIVVPKSLVFNWKLEARRFAPALRVLDHTGTARGKDVRHFSGYDLVLATYGTLRRDIGCLKDFAFDYVILDEAQAVKNAGTDAARAARLLRGNHRLALSGTPIENHLGELWSLLEFLNPGMLGTASVFSLGERQLRNPDAQSRDLLSRALKPFILRRTKGQVAADLPPKQEQTLQCELGSAQRRLYDGLRDYYRTSLLARVAQDGMGKSKIHVLEALLRLRQAACHPALVDPSRAAEPSAKLDLLLPQIQEVMDEGHKILVFSQFTSFLSILRKSLDRDGLCYEYLDGDTRDRSAPVGRFQNDPDCRLFLISLRAGGLGLNLTAAEYVFLLDPWWNPAVEAQAIDRTHRIGQTRPVFAYRIIAADTVEEKVLELQHTKRDLADAIIGENHSLIRELTREDLELLLG